MLKKIPPLIDLLLYGNLFIAGCASASVLQTFLIADAHPDWTYVLFVFFSTLFLYNLQRIVLSNDYLKNPISKRHSWILENKTRLIVLSIIGLCGSFLCILFLGTKLFLIMLALGIISSFYFIPGIGLRKIPALKALLVSLVWAFAGVIVPSILNDTIGGGITLYRYSVFLLFMERCFFILSLCIVFNIRDIEHDSRSNVRTIPSIYGSKTGILAAVSGIIITGILSSLLFYQHCYTLSNFLAMLVSLAITSAVIVSGYSTNSRSNRSEFHYIFTIDGMILLQAMLVCAFNFL